VKCTWNRGRIANQRLTMQGDTIRSRETLRHPDDGNAIAQMVRYFGDTHDLHAF
jgi:hypothetical protein